MKVLTLGLSLFFTSFFCFAQNNQPFEITLGDLNYASPSLNEKAQRLPIPSHIHEIISPTIGAPSLVFEGQAFSIVLQLSPKQKELLAPLSALHFVTRLSPYFGRDVEREIPEGLKKKYKTYFDLADHVPSEIGAFLPFIHFKRWLPRPMQFELQASFESFELFQDKLIITVRMPRAVPSYAYRALDLEILIFKNDQVLLHDIQRHSVGLLEKKEKYRFIHFADPQINNLDLHLRGHQFPHHPDLSTQEFAFFQAIREMNFLNPDFAIVSGDLVDGGNTFHNAGGPLSTFFAGMEMIFEPHNNSADYHLESSSYWNEFQSVFQFFRHLKFPLFVAPGNHDGYAAYEKQNSSATFSQLKFTPTLTGPEAEPVLFDGKHFWQKMFGPRYFSFDFGVWHFVFLDTFDHYRFFRLSYSNFGANDGGWISKEQMAWLEADLKAAERSDKKIILVGHHDPRGGAQGMFYDDPSYRYPRRGILRLGDELWYKFKNFKSNPLFSSQEWSSSETSVDPNKLIDTTYDSAKELMRLIETYPVTHFFLGHVHASYHDVVKLGNKKVHFIHTTALCAQAFQARDREHKKSEGEGEAPAAHWGYRVFELDPRGQHIEELYPLELGNIRLNIGYDENFRRHEGGLLSKSRPAPKWLPFSSFLSKLESQKLLPWLFRNFDPILSLNALLDPSLHPILTQMAEHQDWSQELKNSFSQKMDPLFIKMGDLVGTSEKPNHIFLANGHPFSVQGTLEFPMAREFPNTLFIEHIAADEAEFRLIPIQTYSLPTQTIQTVGGKWGSFDITLPTQSSFPTFLKIKL
ncbi:MAG: metallophosphoesterase [Deltaproteobacteria bacterium]|nr:metallophosphoesterase [Deltaproteobacteria bacterium]